MVTQADYGNAHGTGEIRGVHLRPGNRGANSAKSHVVVLNHALVQLPDYFYDEHGNLQEGKILVRTDSTGSSHEFLYHLDSLPVLKGRFIRWIGEKEYWEPAWTLTGTNVMMRGRST